MTNVLYFVFVRVYMCLLVLSVCHVGCSISVCLSGGQLDEIDSRTGRSSFGSIILCRCVVHVCGWGGVPLADRSPISGIRSRRD